MLISQTDGLTDQQVQERVVRGQTNTRMTVEDAYAICDRIEAALREQAGATSISIHVEPEGKAKHHGVVVL